VILSRVRILPQERFDLEDLNALLSGSRTDAKYHTKKLLSNLNYVINGFTVTGIGLKSATVNMSDGTLIIPNGSGDFSWYTTSPSDPNVTIPDADLVDGTRNYVEMVLVTQDNTPVTRAFWDPEANGGAGLEFNQIVDTITDLSIQFNVLQGGFSGSVDALPLCMIDTDGAGTIKQIFDERILYHRLGTPSNPHATFSWGTKEEPPYAMTLTGVAGAFTDGEQVSIGTEVATVLTGGTTSISIQLPSSKNFHIGDAVMGLTSGATGVVATTSEAFTGVDKSVINLKQDLDAIKTEILLMKTNNANGFWWQQGTSITELVTLIDDIYSVLESPSYDEDSTIVASGATGNDYNGPITSGTNITIPKNSRISGSPDQYYTVGKGALEVYLNGQRLSQNVAEGWSEVGTTGSASNVITIQQTLNVGDDIAFRLGFGGLGAGGGGGGGGAPDDDFITLPNAPTADNADYLLIHKTSINQYRKQLRSVFLAGLGTLRTVQTYSGDHTLDSNLDDIALMNVGASNKTFSLPDPTTCNGKVFVVKKIDAGAFSMIINGAGFLIDGQATISTNTQWQSVTLCADGVGGQWISL
jgi:hypothetical protein